MKINEIVILHSFEEDIFILDGFAYERYCVNKRVGFIFSIVAFPKLVISRIAQVCSAIFIESLK